MTPIKFSVAILFLMLFAKSIVASNPANVKQFINHKDWSFVENKGQLTDENGKLTTDVKYYSHDGGAHLYCRPGKISFVFTKIENEPSSISEATGSSVGFPFPKGAGGFGRTKSVPQLSRITTNRIDLILIGSNPNAEITATDQQAYYENFYLGYTYEAGITNVHTFKTITYKSIYQHIDMVLNVAGQGLEYSFIVHPGGNTDNIQIYWAGAKKMDFSAQGMIKHSTTFGKIEEGKPSSFQMRKIIESSFARIDEKIGFKVGKYNKSEDLIIDPILVWETFFGSDGKGVFYGNSELGQGSAITIDDTDNVLITGYTSSTGLGTSGAYQTSYGGSTFDAFLTKFTSTGKCIWTTYLGGKGNDYSESIAMDKFNNAYICGFTSSDSGFATTGSYSTNFGSTSGNVAFLSKFSSSGMLKWSTYFGSGANSLGFGVCTDKAGNPYIAGVTMATKGIATSGTYLSYNKNIGNTANWVGYLARFTPNGALKWGTYYGEDNAMIFATAATDKNNGVIYLAGCTQGSVGIASAGAYQISNNGGNDAFIAQFDSTGNRNWGTFYGGSNSEQLQAIVIDRKNEVYITGLTTSSSDIATSGSYKTMYGDSGHYTANNAFLAKFSKSGNLLWGTYFGKTQEWGYGLSVDRYNYIYMFGQTSGVGNIATSGSFQSIYKSPDNVFIAKFSSQGKLYYATYADGGLPSGGVVDSMGSCFITGSSDSSYQTSTGAYQPKYNGGYYDAFIERINFQFYYNDAGIDSIIKTNGNECTGTQKIIIKLHNFGSNTLTSATISWSVNGTSQTAYKWTGTLQAGKSTNVIIGNFYFNIGGAKIAAWSSDPNGMFDSLPDNDTAKYGFVINPVPNATTGINRNSCLGASLGIGSSTVSGNIYSWTSKPSGFTATISNPKVSPSTTTTYYLTEIVSATGCSKSDSVSIKILPLPKPILDSNENICPGSSAILNTSSPGNLSYSWTSNPSGFTSTLANPTVSPTVNTTYYLKVIVLTNGCYTTDSINVGLNPKPTSNFSFTNVCPGDSSVFTNKSKSANSYSWSFGDTKTSTLTNPKHLYINTGSYNVGLKVTNTFGCSDSSSQKLTISPCVWPGDANNDKTVDMKDFLAIGIGYGTKGHPRPSANSTWTGQPSPDWDSVFANGINYKHADCNGDSVIDYSDTFAISANYGKSHPKSSPLDQGSPSDPHLSIKYSNDTFFAGDTLKAQIYLGDNANQVKSIYGLKFSVNANPLVFEADKVVLKLNSSFFGTPDIDLLGLKIYNISNSQVDIGLTRISHKNTSGFGNIATLNIPIKATLPVEYNKAALTISDNLQITFNEQKVPLYFTSDSVLIKQDKTGIQNINHESISNLNIFPNPFQTSTTVAYNLSKTSQVQISLFDITGRQISLIENENQLPGDHQLDIDAEKYNLNPGIYLLKFMINGEFVSRHVVKF